MGLFKKGKKEEEFEMVMVKKKKPFYKRVWFWILIILIIIMANSCGKDSTSQAPAGQEQKQSAAPEDKKAKYEILESKVVKEEYSRYVVGKIKNNAGRDVGYLQVEINLYDKEGNQVGSTLSNINNLEKDGVWTFKAMILEENAATYKIKDVTGF